MLFHDQLWPKNQFVTADGSRDAFAQLMETWFWGISSLVICKSAKKNDTAPYRMKSTTFLMHLGSKNICAAHFFTFLRALDDWIYVYSWHQEQNPVACHMTSHQNCSVYLAALIPDLKETIPGACSHSHPIISDAQAADAVIVTCQNSCKHKTCACHFTDTHLMFFSHLLTFIWNKMM